MSKVLTVTGYQERKPIPIIPTLIIGVGKFGHHVGIQLAARLSLTEESLRYEGLVKPILAHINNGQIMPGLVRIMEINWELWLGDDCRYDNFLKDIDFQGAGSAEQRTPPQVREGNRYPDDWTDAKTVIEQDKSIAEQLRQVAVPLREHDMPLRVGNFLPPDKDHDLLLRILVICAAREADTAVLTPALIELLSKTFVIPGQARGVQILCYAGGTTRVEHIEAGGTDEEFDEREEAETNRIRPVRSTLTSSSVGLLDELEELRVRSGPQTIETCYLLDINLENQQAAVQGRHDEPDEIVVAAALAANMFITTDADQYIRRTAPRAVISSTLRQPASQQGKYSPLEPGFFATFGISSYAIDHPKLRRLMYSKVIGDFLLAVQPRTMAEVSPSRAALIGFRDDELAEDQQLDIKITRDIQKQTSEFSKAISFKSISRKIAKKGLVVFATNKKSKYKNAVAALQQCDASNRQSVHDELDKIIEKLSEDMRNLKLTSFILQRQSLYKDILQFEISFRLQDIYVSQQAPLTYAYRFLLNCVEALKKETEKYLEILPPTLQANRQRRDKFVQDQEDLYERTMGEKVTEICAVLMRPRWWFGRLTQTKFRKILKQLEERYAIILQRADMEAWQGALTENYIEIEQLVTQRVKPLCAPNGVISKLRDESLAEEFTLQDRLLERVFFDDRLKQELKLFSQQLAKHGMLWDRRKQLLKQLLELEPVDGEKIGAWLREQAELLYKDNTLDVASIVKDFLDAQTSQRLNDMWYNLSNVAVPFLRHDVFSQDDPVIEIKLFSVHELQKFANLDTLAKRSGVWVLDSTDRLRWIFMNVHVGLHLAGITFSVETPVP